MAYVDPEEALSPKGRVKELRVVYNTGRTRGSWSLATLKWDEQERVGLRWNGEEGEQGKGQPQSRGNPTWFIVPEELSDEILQAARQLRQREHHDLTNGYRAMAADRAREEEAEQWTEASTADLSQAG
ncbi:MAG: hypothetical protein WBW84_10300 [Acidobacteriaceae bacterium]